MCIHQKAIKNLGELAVSRVQLTWKRCLRLQFQIEDLRLTTVRIAKVGTVLQYVRSIARRANFSVHYQNNQHTKHFNTHYKAIEAES